MKSIRIAGLRSLVDTGHIELKPITLLLGRNSSGKSSFLRMLPVLRQSLERGKKNPLVLNGRFIDLDNLKVAVSNFTNLEEATVELYIEGGGENPYYYNRRYYYRRPIVSRKYIISSTFSPSGERDNYVKRLKIEMDSSNILLEFSNDKKISKGIIDGIDCSDLLYDVTVDSSNYIPIILDGPLFLTHNVEHTPFENAIISEVRKYSHGRLADYKITKRLFSLRATGVEETLRHVVASDFGKVWRTNTEKWSVNSEGFVNIFRIIKAAHVAEVLIFVQDMLETEARAIRYIAPVRASAQRYYRFNDTSVSEIDAFGSNVSMYLYNMTDSEKKHFRDWTLSHFGFEFFSRSKYGHLSLTVNDGNGEVNLADTGFGYSQILPILVHLWSSQHYRNRRFPVIQSMLHAIEQPELHLHPQMIGRLTDALCAIVRNDKENDVNHQFILETHSKTMVDRLGENIIRNKIKPEDVSVVLFDRNVSTEPSIVQRTRYSEEGFLLDWPSGFLCADL